MAMNIQMPASLMLVAWVARVAAILWRRSRQPAAAGAVAPRLSIAPKTT